MASTSDPLTIQWRADQSGQDEADLLRELEPLAREYELSVGASRSSQTSYLDTVDWRLRNRGLILRHERGTSGGAGDLVVTTTDRTQTTALSEDPQWPARIEHLPAGSVRDAVANAMWIRAISPVLRCRTQTRDIALLNSDGKTVVRLDVIRAEGIEPKTPSRARIVVRPVLGYGRDGARVAKLLLAGKAFEEAKEGSYDALLVAAGLPAVRTRATFDAETPADAAIAAALLGFADVITENVDGVVKNIDSEFLHDLRVAVRRTRSLLKLVGDVLPSDMGSRHGVDFRLLGDVTTPTRDLDVYLLELPQLAGWLTVGTPEDLEPFSAHLQASSVLERRKLVRALNSKRFAQLFEGWRKELTAVVESSGQDKEGRKPTAGQLAAQRIRRTYKQVVRKARAITPESEAEAVHSLRKRCKELRYLLEVFAPVCDPEAHRAAIKDLKQLQDILGAFQDGEMQSEGLRVFAAQMMESGQPPAATLLAMGELSARFGRQQREAREALADQLDYYLGPKAHHRVEVLLP